MTLTEIANKYPSTDKFRNNKDGHCYGPFYEVALAPYRNLPITLLEIGVSSGDSLRIWQEYFPHAHALVGIDLILPTTPLPQNVILIQANAYQPLPFLGYFDIIIDDGPHTLKSQAEVIQYYLPKLKPGGLLVIEDIINPIYLKQLSELVPAHLRHRVSTFDLRSQNQRPDDILFVVQS